MDAISNINNRFISVVLPPQSDNEQYNDEFTFPKSLVFNSHKDALNILKKVKNSRFKVFDNYNEAFKYSLENSFNEEFLKKFEDENSFKKVNNENETLNSCFTVPNTPQLTKFRKLIENNNYDGVKKLIENPRYLINSCETPVVLMEGPRYNCFHVSYKKYLQQLFFKDDDEAVLFRVKHILDLYINTSDKVLHDTPLHLACKFGSYECVEILLNCDLCIKDRLNKNKKTPYNVICDRKNDLLLKQKIQHLFELDYYLPIVRTSDKDIMIGQPINKKPNENSISAIAGPMELTTANNLYEKLKSPRYRSKNEILVRLTDYSKGIERIARNHCKQIGVSWKEYWAFLKKNLDITTNEGLQQLENYFSNISTSVYIKGEFNNYFNNININCSNDKKCEINLNECKSEINYNEVNEDVFYTAPSSPNGKIITNDCKNVLKNNYDFYINGDKLSENDIDVFIALQEVCIDEKEFPLITKWFKNVNQVIELQKKKKLNDFLNISKYNSTLNTSKLNYSFNTSLNLNLSEKFDSSFIMPEKVVLKELICPLK